MTQHSDGQSNVLKFRQLVDSDPALQAELASCVGGGRWNLSAIVAMGAARGLAFSADELKNVLEEDNELTDFELEMVAAAGVAARGAKAHGMDPF